MMQTMQDKEMDHRTIRALNGMHARDPDQAHIQTEVLNRLDWLIEALAHSQASTPAKMDFAGLAQSLWFRAALLIILAPASGLTLKEALNLMLG